MAAKKKASVKNKTVRKTARKTTTRASARKNSAFDFEKYNRMAFGNIDETIEEAVAAKKRTESLRNEMKECAIKPEARPPFSELMYSAIAEQRYIIQNINSMLDSLLLELLNEGGNTTEDCCDKPSQGFCRNTIINLVGNQKDLEDARNKLMFLQEHLTGITKRG